MARDLPYIDINPEYNRSKNSELLFGINAIVGSLKNLLSTRIGERFFQPEYGSSIYNFIFEPMNDETAYDILLAIISDVERWEPRVEVDLTNSTVDPDLDNGSYFVSLKLIVLETKDIANFEYVINRENN